MWSNILEKLKTRATKYFNHQSHGSFNDLSRSPVSQQVPYSLHVQPMGYLLPSFSDSLVHSSCFYRQVLLTGERAVYSLRSLTGLVHQSMGHLQSSFAYRFCSTNPINVQRSGSAFPLDFSSVS
jgi:hypothetical protein